MNMAVAALFGFPGADGVGNESAVTLAGKSRRGDGLLLVIEPVAVRILRTYEDRATGTRGSDAMSGDGAVDAQHINVVAQDLEIVAGVVARHEAFVVEHGAFRVGGHLQVAAETGGRP